MPSSPTLTAIVVFLLHLLPELIAGKDFSGCYLPFALSQDALKLGRVRHQKAFQVIWVINVRKHNFRPAALDSNT